MNAVHMLQVLSEARGSRSFWIWRTSSCEPPALGTGPLQEQHMLLAVKPPHLCFSSFHLVSGMLFRERSILRQQMFSKCHVFCGVRGIACNYRVRGYLSSGNYYLARLTDINQIHKYWQVLQVFAYQTRSLLFLSIWAEYIYDSILKILWFQSIHNYQILRTIIHCVLSCYDWNISTRWSHLDFVKSLWRAHQVQTLFQTRLLWYSSQTQHQNNSRGSLGSSWLGAHLEGCLRLGKFW